MVHVTSVVLKKKARPASKQMRKHRSLANSKTHNIIPILLFKNCPGLKIDPDPESELRCGMPPKINQFMLVSDPTHTHQVSFKLFKSLSYIVNRYTCV